MSIRRSSTHRDEQYRWHDDDDADSIIKHDKERLMTDSSDDDRRTLVYSHGSMMDDPHRTKLMLGNGSLNDDERYRTSLIYDDSWWLIR